MLKKIAIITALLIICGAFANWYANRDKVYQIIEASDLPQLDLFLIK